MAECRRRNIIRQICHQLRACQDAFALPHRARSAHRPSSTGAGAGPGVTPERQSTCALRPTVSAHCTQSPATAGAADPRDSLFQREHVLDQGLDVGVLDGDVRRHGHCAPDARATFLDLGDELRFGRGIAGVLLRRLVRKKTAGGYTARHNSFHSGARRCLTPQRIFLRFARPHFDAILQRTDFVVANDYRAGGDV